MASRLKLHEELCEILGNKNVYFNPPESLKLQYPCIVYSKVGIDLNKANDRVYKSMPKYEATVVTKDPDSDIPDEMLNHFSYCVFDRSFIADNLNHYVLTIFY